jgi:hypothetical protein
MPRANVEPLVERVRSEWGTGVLMEVFCPSVDNDPILRDQYARFQRASASPGAAAAYLRALCQMDVRPALPLVSAPTLVLHAARDLADPIEAARYTADRIPNAKLVELDSADHLIWLTDALDSMVNEIQDFVQAAVPSEPAARVLATVMFVDVPTGPPEEQAAQLVARHRGRVVNRDSGLLATFDGPARAIRCAQAIVAESRATHPVRVGLHCGECELVANEIRGIAVTLAREIARTAQLGQVLLTQTVRDLIFGSDIALQAHDQPTFDDLPGQWSTFLVIDN